MLQLNSDRLPAFGQLVVLSLLLLLLTGAMVGARKYASTQTFDAIATGLTFVAAVVLVGSVASWGIGLIAGAVFTWLARRIAMGKILRPTDGTPRAKPEGPSERRVRTDFSLGKFYACPLPPTSLKP